MDKIKKVLGSYRKVQLIRFLAKNPSLLYTKYQIRKSLGIDSKTLGKYLKDLEEVKWLKTFPYRPRKYCLNLKRGEVSLFVKFLQEMERDNG